MKRMGSISNEVNAFKQKRNGSKGEMDNETWLRICLACVCGIMVIGGCSGPEQDAATGEKILNEGRADLLVAIIHCRKRRRSADNGTGGILRAEEEGIALYVFAEDGSTNRISRRCGWGSTRR